MALSLYQKIFNKFFRRFTLQWGREPQSAKEWMDLRNLTTREINKTKGVPAGPKKPPFQGWKPEVIQGGKGIESLLKSGDVKKGVAPKTTKETLKGKKDRHILFRDAEEDISRIKRENKQAIEDFKKKQAKKKTVEDFRDEGDFDPGGMASGGRIGLAGGGALFKFIEQLFMKASNDIRLGRGKWKGLDQKQIAVQHDNLTKKVIEFQKTKKLPEGTEQYFDVNPHEAFAATQKTVKKERTMDDLVEQAYDEIAGGSGFSGDIKYDADILASEIATTGGKIYDDLADVERMGIYDLAYSRMAKNLKAKMDFQKGLKDVEQKIELQMFDPKDRLPNQSGGPINQQALIQMYMEEGLSYDDAVAAAQSTSGLDMDLSKKAHGGRADFIFGGSAGLKAMWRQMLKSINKGRDKPVKRLFPTLSSEERAMEKMVMGTPEQKAFREGDVAHRLEGIELLINRLKNDKKIIERRAKNKAMRDPSLDFLMKDLEKSFSDAYTPHLKKYTDIDKDVLQMENIKKNLIMKDRKLNAEGGLAYMLGEPTYMKYEGGGSVGHAPWHKPTAQQQPPQQQQPGPAPQQQPGPAPQGGGQAPGGGRPNPMKAPRGLPSLAPRTMDPAVMQQQAMQRMMMGQQGQQGQQRGQPRMRYATGEQVYGPSLPEEKIKSPTGEYKTREEIIAEAGIGSGPSLLDYVKPIPQYDEHGNQIPTFSKTGKKQIEGAPEGITSDKEYTNFIMSLDIPITEKISILGSFRYHKFRDKVEEGDEELYLDDSPSYIGKNIGIGLNQGNEGFSGYAKYDIDTEKPEFGIKFSKKFNQGGRVPMMYGGDPGFAFEYGGSWADWRDQHQHQMPVTDYIKTKLPKERLPFRDMQSGGIARLPLGLGSMSRRAFLKMLATLGIGTAAAKSGVSLLSKTAPKVIKEAEVITRGADGMPTYITDLIEVVKAKGTRDVIEGFKRSDYSTVHSYKGVDVIEEAGGTTRIKKSTEGVAEDASTGKMHEGTSKEIEIEIIPGKVDVMDEGTGAQRSFQTTDEYMEGTVRPDRDGKMKDFEEYIDDLDHLELKKIADEVDTLIIKKSKKIKKASGGLAHMLGE